ncbi:MAG: M90 family metallopeptidase [Tahibacter sp.]
MFDWLRRWQRRFSRTPIAIPDALWNTVLAQCAVLHGLDLPQREHLRFLAGQFLAEKRYSAIPGVKLDDERCLIIAAQACLPVLQLGFRHLRGWRDVIVYPGEFRVRREHHDEDTGIVTEGDDLLIGEAWERGPLILSWADIDADLADPHAGFNVIIHEIAHKLDMFNGASDGVPELPAGLSRREWITTFQSAFVAHSKAVEAGLATEIDPYAAESPDEFFACLCEAWYSDPARVCRAMPRIAALLERFFLGHQTPPD